MSFFRARNRGSAGRKRRRRRQLLMAGTIFFVALCFCSTIAITAGQRVLDAVLRREPSPGASVAFTWEPDSAELTVAVSPVMAPYLQERADAFDAQGRRTPDGKTMRVVLVEHSPEKMVKLALEQPPFQALSPDSSLWLGQIDRRWAELYPPDASGIAPRRVTNPVRYAVSPIVIAAWESVARELGWPERPVGWQEIQRKATADPNFKWNHPSTQNAAGLLATLAEFYAGAGLTRGLTEEAATQPAVLNYVRDVEATVRFYGEGEDVIVQRLREEGRDFLEAFVAQEQTVIAWNQRGEGERLVALYPKEGTLWTDHPLALLELDGRTGPAVTDNQRRTFRAFADFLLSTESQQAFLAAGYRPADLDIDLATPGSPFADRDAVDPGQPKTTLQIPSAAVVDVVQNVWWYTKRPTNVYLVVDTSGSMEGVKLERTQAALRSFVSQIQGDRDQVGLVEFGSGVKHFEPLRVVDNSGRIRLLQLIGRMNASGYTALIDAVLTAYGDLQSTGDTDAINAIVVMTDGRENDSVYDLGDLQRAFREGGVPVVVFTIAFGRDADDGLLRDMARIGGGQFRRADETDIEELYRVISTYF